MAPREDVSRFRVCEIESTAVGVGSSNSSVAALKVAWASSERYDFLACGEVSLTRVILWEMNYYGGP